MSTVKFLIPSLASCSSFFHLRDLIQDQDLLEELPRNFFRGPLHQFVRALHGRQSPVLFRVHVLDGFLQLPTVSFLILLQCSEKLLCSATPVPRFVSSTANFLRPLSSHAFVCHPQNPLLSPRQPPFSNYLSLLLSSCTLWNHPHELNRFSATKHSDSVRRAWTSRNLGEHARPCG